MTSAISSWFCMNEVGTGKTFTVVNSVLLHAKHLENEQNARRPIVARPTLYVCPAPLVAQTFQEVYENFPEIKVYCFYSSTAAISQGDPRRGATINVQQFDDLMCQWADDTDNVDVARTIIITAYTTLSSRWLVTTKFEYDTSKWIGHWVHDQCVERKGTRSSLALERGSDQAGPEDQDDEDDEAATEISAPMGEDDADQSRVIPKLDKDYGGDYQVYAEKHGYGSFKERHLR